MRFDASRIRSADISLSGAIATPHAPRPAVIPLRRPSDEGRPASASARRPRRQARRTSTAWVGLSLSRSSSAHPPYPGVEDGPFAFERSRRADDHAGGELPARYLTPSRPRCEPGTATPPGHGPDGVGWIQL